MSKPTNSSGRLRRNLAELASHGDSEIPRPSDDQSMQRNDTADQAQSQPPPADGSASEHWYG